MKLLLITSFTILLIGDPGILGLGPKFFAGGQGKVFFEIFFLRSVDKFQFQFRMNVQFSSAPWLMPYKVSTAEVLTHFVVLLIDTWNELTSSILLNPFSNLMEFMVLTNFKYRIIITLQSDQVHFGDIFSKPCKVFLHSRNPIFLYFFTFNLLF